MREKTAEHPEMVAQFLHEFKETRQPGKPVKRWWFVRQAKQVLN